MSRLRGPAARGHLIRFGTDGWRAVIAEEFTFANIARVAQATADLWQGTNRRVVVGYDRRFLSDQFARRTAEVFLGNGFEVILADAPTPTPAVSYAVKKLRAVGGVMITASHNPPAFNGFKLKAAYGGPASPLDCSRVETLIDQSSIQRTPLNTAGRARCAERDLLSPLLAAVRRQVDYSIIARSRLHLAHDAMFGVGAGAFERLLEGTSCRVTTLNGRHDPNFGGINPEPIPRNYAATTAYLRRHPHDLCVVTDGDADRIGGLDGRGNPLSTHQIICLLLVHLLQFRQARGRVITALTTSSMVDKICSEHGIELVKTGVGFKHITAEMIRGGVLLGAEESGGIGFPEHLPERDGLLAGMILLELLAVRRRSINQLIADLERRYGAHRYDRRDLPFPTGESTALMEFCRKHPPARLRRSPVVEVNASDGIKYTSADGSWLMLRASGTEPLVRIYAEATTEADARRLVQDGVQLTERSGLRE